jgi:alcohol dehydrogenase (cytochrome c)
MHIRQELYFLPWQWARVLARVRIILFVALATMGAGHATGQEEESRAPRASAGPVSFQMKPVTADVSNTDAQRLQADADVDNWRLHGRTYDNQRFSPLKQINDGNVRLLRPKFLIQTGVANSMEATPIVIDGIMFVETAGNIVQAYDAVTGEELWAYQPVLGYSDLCCGPQSRGIAVGYGKVFVAQLDGNVVALDARTGKVVWKTEKSAILPAPNHWYSFTAAPQVYDGLVTIGNAGAEWPTRGFLEALDAETGQLVWRFWDTAGPTDPNFKGSWESDSWKIGGGSIWDAAAIDTKLGLAFVGIGNPNPDMYGDNRKGNNIYTDSIVAVDAKTGKLAWYYQQVPHDVWDLDSAAPVVLLDVLDRRGKLVPAAAEASKNGSLYIVDRKTGALIRKSDPFVRIGPNFGIPPDATPRVYYPANHGGAMWQPPAFSPVTHYFYTMGNNEPAIYKAQPSVPWKPGASEIEQHFGNARISHEEADRLGLTAQRFKPFGNLSAIDVNTGKIAWQYESNYMMMGGVLATAGNLVFTGEFTGNFEAFNAKTGAKLWSYHLGIGVCTPPITYRVKGVQYIAVGANGCHQSEEIMKVEGRPTFGDTIAIFSLPDND